MEDASLSVAAFYLLAALAVLGGSGVAFSRNIVYSALSLMLAFMGVSGLYILCGAEFVAGVQVLVYVGGVLVLTLFAVMLTQGIAEVEVSNRSVGSWPALAIVIGLFAVMQRALGQATFHANDPVEPMESTYAVGNALLSTYVLPFELASIVLLVVLVGAVVISRKEIRPDAPGR